MKISIMFLLLLATACRQKTTIPKEFVNTYLGSREVYKEDTALLANAIKVRYDSINQMVEAHNVTKFLDVKIDTVFYGNNNKIAFLVTLCKKNEYGKKSIQYVGECYIAYKKTNIENLYQLRYSSTSTESLEKASKMIRVLYLQEMNYIDGRYNINDTRFWNSCVWEEAKETEDRRKIFDETKKKNPENVYDPNDRK